MKFPAPDPQTCLMYLVRHGATDNNLANPPRLQGSRSNPPLSAQGRAQAEAAAALLSDAAPAAILASPMLRAQETAEIIARPHGLPLVTVEALIECDVGQWEGRDWGDIERADPAAFRAFMDDPGAHPYAGGESIAEVVARVRPAFEAIYEAHRGRAVIVVAHNVVNRAYLGHLMRIPMNRVRDIPQSNCGVNLLAHRADKTSIVTINAAFHLPG